MRIIFPGSKRFRSGASKSHADWVRDMLAQRLDAMADYVDEWIRALRTGCASSQTLPRHPSIANITTDEAPHYPGRDYFGQGNSNPWVASLRFRLGFLGDQLA